VLQIIEVNMQIKARYYSGQFATTPDLLHVTIPQGDIVPEMIKRGEQETLNDICLSVAVVADAIASAQLAETN
jgi:hypothetical protein